MANKFSNAISNTTGLSPEEIGDIIFDLDANSHYLWTDASKTTRAHTGDLVYTFDEQINSFSLVQATSAARPTLGTTAVNGINYIYSSDGARWIRTADLTGAQATTLIGLDRDPITVVVFCEYTTTPVTTTRYLFGMFEENSSNGVHACAFTNAVPDTWFFRRYDSATGRSVSVSTTENPYTLGLSMFAHRYAGDSRLNAFVNGIYKGRATAFAAQGSPNTISLFTTGSNAPTSLVETDSKFYRAVMFNKALTNDELLRLYLYASNLYK